MNPDRPKVSFTFPYRWLNEDREFFQQNLTACINKGGLNVPMHSRLQQNFISQYAVVLKYHSYQPVKINLTKKQLETLLKPTFPGATCVYYETFFVQANSPDILPTLEMEIFY